MLVRVLLAAMLAGVLAGVFASGAQSLRVTPLILEAETYESGDSHGAAAHADGETAATGSGHEWAPDAGWERGFYTLIANIVVDVGFALLLTAAILVSGQAIALGSGLAWGLAGFLTFVLAPAVGLPPELPGMPAADLGARQAWWLATVIATGSGLALIALMRAPLSVAAGLVLIALPHLYGAPAPVEHETAVPAHLAAEFVVASLATAFAHWLFLGGVAGFLLERALRAEAAPAAKEASA